MDRLVVPIRQVAVMAGIQLDGEMMGPPEDDDSDIFTEKVCIAPVECKAFVEREAPVEREGGGGQRRRGGWRGMGGRDSSPIVNHEQAWTRFTIVRHL